MGYLQASEMARLADLDTALSWHLASNHFPPLPASLVPACKRAITNARDGEWDKQVRMPPEVSYKGRRTAPTSALIEELHLDAFLATEGRIPKMSEQLTQAIDLAELLENHWGGAGNGSLNGERYGGIKEALRAVQSGTLAALIAELDSNLTSDLEDEGIEEDEDE